MHEHKSKANIQKWVLTKKSHRQQYVKRSYTHIASNREENAHLLFKEDNKLMIQRAETFTTTVTTLLQLPRMQKLLRPSDAVNVKEQKVKRQDLNR